MLEQQRTIKREISLEGVGLHTGNATTITFKPAPPDSGIRFIRTDLPGNPSVVADIDYVVDISRGTSLANGDARVYTVEHVLAAIYGLQIDNLEIELTSNESPVGDGSSLSMMPWTRRARNSISTCGASSYFRSVDAA